MSAHAELNLSSPDLFGDLPLSSRVRVEFGAQSRPGKNHPINGDHHLIVRLGRSQDTLITSLPDDIIGDRFDEYGYAMIVADGLGNPIESEAAGRVALSTLLQLVIHFAKWNLRVDCNEIEHEIRMRADRFFHHVDLALTRQSAAGPIGNLQTSLTTTFGAGRDLFYAHVGHSRAYLFRDRMLLRLTHDHTISARREPAPRTVRLVDVKVMTRDFEHILEQSLGMSGPAGPRVHIGNFTLQDRDQILVCTNGITDVVDDVAIADLFDSHRPVEECCATLVDLAVKAGGEDDATAMVARYHVPA